MQKNNLDSDNRFSALELRPGQQGVIGSVQGDDLLRRRLNALGMVRGASLVADQTAPMGDPRSYTVLGYQISLRKEEAAHIILQPAS